MKKRTRRKSPNRVMTVTCESCFRDFFAIKEHWGCAWCGADNRPLRPGWLRADMEAQCGFKTKAKAKGKRIGVKLDPKETQNTD